MPVNDSRASSALDLAMVDDMVVPSSSAVSGSPVLNESLSLGVISDDVDDCVVAADGVAHKDVRSHTMKSQAVEQHHDDDPTATQRKTREHNVGERTP